MVLHSRSTRHCGIVAASLLLLAVAMLPTPALRAQCVGIQYDYSSTRLELVNREWDTIVTCDNPSIWLRATMFMPVTNFNGMYVVESIPYNPPELFVYGTRLSDISSDDQFDNDYITIDFPFAFFGYTKTRATVGSNGVVTFTQGAPRNGCPWQFSAGLPWPTSSAGVPTLTYIRDAIYGVFEDTHPGYIPQNEQRLRGIFKGVSPASDFPCRHVTVSWSRLPLFSNQATQATFHSTYQIVFYESTNIIEVHVQQRRATNGQGNCSWNGGNGLIGIQNSTGQPQQPSAETPFVVAGSPAAFAPGLNNNLPNRNPFTHDVANEAWRFTPQGTTDFNVIWYKGTDTNAATAIVLQNRNYTVNGQDSILVTPDTTTTYTCRLQFTGSNGYHHDCCTYITVGVNSKGSIHLSGNNTTLCEGDRAILNITCDTTPRSVNWTCSDPLTVPNVTLHGDTAYTPPVYFPPNSRGDDSMLTFYATATFPNGCERTDSIQVKTMRPIHQDTSALICRNEKFLFYGDSLQLEGDYVHVLYNDYGCAYNDTLHLRLRDDSYTVDYQSDCHPFTWIDGNTYDTSNYTATYTLHDRFGCDSVMALNFELDRSLHALIEATPRNATLDQLNIQLRDRSTGSSSRQWIFPNGETSSSPTTYYNFPAKEDSIEVMLVATSRYGCSDTDTIVIPLLKEALWVPNVFMPKRESNNRFIVRGIGITWVHTYVFRRTGELLYDWEGLDGGWDGTSNGHDCKEDSYIYLVEYRTIVDPDKTLNKKGTVLLLR